MNYSRWIIISIIILLIILVILTIKYYKSILNKFDYFSVSSISPAQSPRNSLIQQKKWKGICLFDIDGTLTTGINNSESIDLCIKAGYVVGISTAGAMYTPDKLLLSFDWMPKNLYNFMKHNDFKTFNNVASGIITGKYDSSAYQDIRNKFKNQHIMWGLLKARSIIRTAKLYNIFDFNKMILFDNDPLFLKGLHIYNPEIRGICAGMPCGANMTPQLIRNVL